MIRTSVQLPNFSNIVDNKVPPAVAKAQVVLDEQVLKDSNYFIPKDEGYLEDSGVTASRIGDGEIIWSMAYAAKLYYNPQYDFSKDSNPNAQGTWFEVAKAIHKQDWTKLTQDEVKKNL